MSFIIVRHAYVVMAVLSSFALTIQAQVSNDSLVRRAWYIQDQRSDADGHLARILEERSADVRSAGFRAVANLRDTSWAPAVLKGLHDGQPSVRRMAAFAAGQLAQRTFAGKLLASAEEELNGAVRDEMLDAFGRVGIEADLDSLIDRWSHKPTLTRSSAIAAMVRFSIRSIRTPRAVWYAVECLTDRRADIRWKAMYALGRWAPHPTVATEVASRLDRFVAATKDRSPDVRLNTAIVLGKTDSEVARELLVQFSAREARRRDSDWRVRVQIVRAAAAQMRKDGTMLGLILGGLRDKNDHVSIASSMALPSDAPSFRALEGRDSLRSTLWWLVGLDSGRAPLVSGEAIVALLRFMPDQVLPVIEHMKQRTLSQRLLTKYVEAISQSPQRESWDIVRGYWDDVRASVAMAAWDNSRRFFRPAGIRSIARDEASTHNISQIVHDGMSRALARGDMGLSTVVGTLLADSNVVALLESGGLRNSIAESLCVAVGRMKIPDDVETLQAALQALAVLGGPRAKEEIERQFSSKDRSVAETAVAAWSKLTGSPPREGSHGQGGPDHTDYDWKLIGEIKARPRVELLTSRGTFVLQLLVDDAPFTVVSFIRLVRSGYFNGLTFHRVVPNFVVQGGDPRGDGWGGPGYALRTESSLLAYERGTVGMASAGFDTEGSQFFITHVATPHLNGRYTIFAQVIEGIDVVDRLQVGDTIQEIRYQAGARQRGARSR